MADKKRALGLGRGLAALLEEIGSPNADGSGDPLTLDAPAIAGMRMLPIALIRANPRQPRRHFDPTAMDELVASIQARGLVQPILVRPLGNGDYEIVAGERRWRAAQRALLHEVPVVVREFDERTAFELALIENIQRADLNPIEEAEGFQRLIDEYGYGQEQIAEATGKSRSHVANLLRLLRLPEPVLDMVRRGELSMGHARALIGHDDAEEIAERVVEGELSVRQTEALVASQSGRERQARPRTAAGRAPGNKDPDTEALERALSESIGLKVTIEGTGIAGRLVIDYASLDQLDMVAQRLSGGRF